MAKKTAKKSRKKVTAKTSKSGTSKARGRSELVKTTPSAQGSCEWSFRTRAKQDPRNFGNAALYATPQEVKSLVRETGQNSLDAAIESTEQKQVVMRYRLIELPNGCARRNRFLKALQWENGLQPHLRAVSQSQGKATNTAARVKSALKELNDTGSTLWLLAVEDYGTRGLEGDEYDSDSPYCALVRDSENSNKSNAGAGGSFGLGSKTLFACSDLLTVFFASEPASKPGQTRVIGKADFGFHQYAGGAPDGYVGHGHFGIPYEGDAAESQWHKSRDAQLLKDLCMQRSCPVEGIKHSGTTALIVAFADPKADTQSAEGILKELRQAAAFSFWPAMVRGELRVFLRHERGDDYVATDDEVQPASFLPSFVDAYQKQQSATLETSLTHPGDVVSVPVPHTVPATKLFGETGSGHPDVPAEARLIIRMSDPTSVDYDLRDHVALVRGRAMVVRYVPKKNVTLGARPFHAILAAGTLVSASGHQPAAETFLRFAEPPAHDKWEASNGLRARYAWGAGARLTDLFDEMTQQLREYVGSSQESGEDIPEILKDIFKIADIGRPKQALYKLTQPSIVVEANSISVQAEIECPDASGHTVRPVVTFATESGKGFEMQWSSLTPSVGSEAGGRINVPIGTRRIRITGILSSSIQSIDLHRCAYKIAIKGSKTAGEA